MQPYIYKPLAQGEIRLLTLHPGAEGTQVSISLDNTPLPPARETKQNVKLSLKELQKTLPAQWTVWETLGNRILFYNTGSKSTSWTHPCKGFDKALYTEIEQISGLLPPFDALSYTWGLEDNCIEVHVVEQIDHSKNILGSVQIRPNLDAALRHLRYVDRPRKLWIDAVCINQRNMQERSEQVQRMTDIYQGATRVVVWLGTASNNSTLAFSTLKLLGQELEMTRDNFFYPHPEALHRDWHHVQTELPFDTTIWLAFTDLFQRPWFERLWIWQEAHLARKGSLVQCGDDTLDWPTFRRTVRRLYWAVVKSPSRFSSKFKSRIDHVDYLVSNHTGISFNRWIAVANRALCTNPSDRVYGLLGLAPPAYAKAIKPDYKLPVEEVYKSTVIAELAITNSLTLLCHCGNPQQRSVVTPSWVPDWSQEKATQTTGLDFAFMASGRSAAYAEYVSPSRLVVRGVMYGTITSVSAPYKEDQGLDVLSGWAPPELYQARYVSGESLLDAYLLTLWGGEVADYTGYSHHPTLDNLRSTFSLRRDSLVLATDIRKNTADGIISNTSRWIPGRILVTTTEGYIGLAPQNTKNGDVVCVLLGCPLPMVLRPTSCDEYQVVGSGYVHGLMDGEGILGAMPTGWTKKPVRTEGNFDVGGFYNSETSYLTFEDPRIEPLSTEWDIDAESMISLRRIAEPKFVNRKTGMVRDTDPRLTIEALRHRGIKLQSITLI